MLEYHTVNQTNLTNLFRKQINQPYVINKAFKSLLFRGCKGYSATFMTKQLSSPQKEERKTTTYGAILCYRNKYALVQGRYTGKWSFPKGHSNEGEQPLECTLREVAEETGIDILPHPIEYKSLGYGKYYVFIMTEQSNLVPRDTKEIMDTKWVTLEEMESMSLNADVSMFRKKLKELSE
jgi:ADP-ribose pyrophosphatase YjhB (NUDIX family)